MKKEQRKIVKQALIVEKANNEFWGRVKINNNLIVDVGSTLEVLKRKLKKAVSQIENTEIQNFDISFDLSSFFDQYSFLNVTDLASKIGISPILMRQYTSGNKFPSETRVKQIEEYIRVLGKELSKINLHKAKKEYAG